MILLRVKDGCKPCFKQQIRKHEETNNTIAMILERRKWQEFYPDGKLWIDGEIGLVADLWKHLYDYRTGFTGYEGKPVVRLGVWTKYSRAGKVDWQIDYGDGTHERKRN